MRKIIQFFLKYKNTEKFPKKKQKWRRIITQSMTSYAKKNKSQ